MARRINGADQKRLLIEEVLYLHSLWHRGPPRRSSPNPNPNPIPATALRPATADPPAFKNKKIKKQNNNKKTIKKRPATPEKEWPCPPTPAPTPAPAPDTDLWAPLKAAAPPNPRPPSAEEQARAAASRAQYPGLKACDEFFGGKSGSDSESEEEDDPMDEDASGAEFQFFLQLFKEEGELRRYYEENCEKGEFYCLVCRGIGEKKRRLFPDCVGLVQHAVAVSKTKRRGAHRMFAKAVCRVLGWNMERLPSIVLDLNDPLGKSLAKDGDTKEEGVIENVEKISKESAGFVSTNVDFIETDEENDTTDGEENILKEVTKSA